ncbi:MAG: hypothetical protein ACP5F0_06190, partial [Sulfurihydrogenibium sp.]
AAYLNAGNTTVAEEVIGAFGGYDVKVTNAYQVDQPIAAGNKIKLTLSGAKFSVGSGGNIYICTSNTQIGVGTVATGGAEASILISAAMGAGTIYYFADVACSTTSVAISNKYVHYSISTGTKAGQTVTLTIAGLQGAAGIADTQGVVATVKKQFTAQINPTSARIDLTNLKAFFRSDSLIINSLTIQAPFRVISDETIADRFVVNFTNPNTCDGKIKTNTTLGGIATNGWSATFTLKGKFQEYSLIAIIDTTGFTPIKQRNIEASDRTNGQVTISNFDLGANGIVCKNALDAPTYIQLKVDGQTQIQEDTKKLTITFKNGSYTSDLLTDATAFIVKLNATTLYVPLVGVNPATGRETYIKLQMSNNIVSSTDVTFFILAGDGSIVATYNKTLTAGQPLTVTGTELKNAAIAAGKTVGDSFAVRIVIPNQESEIYAYANIVDPSGAKRVPVKVECGKIVE